MSYSVSSQDLVDYKENGFLVVKEFFPKELIDQICTVSTDVIDQHAEKHWDGYAAVFQQVHLPRNYDQQLDLFSRNLSLAQAASKLMGCGSVRLFLDQIICKRPTSKRTVPHQDAPFLSFDDTRSLNCWIPLTDVTIEMGAMSYYAGTHKLGNLGLTHLDYEAGLDERVPILKNHRKLEFEASAGDCLFHNCLTVHSARANTSDKNRMAYAIQYMPEDAKYNGWEHLFMKELHLRNGELLNNNRVFPKI